MMHNIKFTHHWTCALVSILVVLIYEVVHLLGNMIKVSDIKLGQSMGDQEIKNSYQPEEVLFLMLKSYQRLI